MSTPTIATAVSPPVASPSAPPAAVRRRRGLPYRVISWTVSPAIGLAIGGSIGLVLGVPTGDRHDRALWTATAKASGAAGNSTALVGTPGTVARALLDYHDLGVTTFLIRGYDPLGDAVDYGRELIPAVRAEIARRDTTLLAGVA